MDKSIIIIGAGIAGLSTGCYLKMNGYKTKIFEMHTIPGGVCTTWKRKGYKIDGCIHWLGGYRPGHPFHPMWEEVGALKGRTFIDHEEFIRIEGSEGKVLIVYADLNRLEQHMKDLAPEDSNVIEEFINAAIDLTRPSASIEELMKKWGIVSVSEFAQRFKNPFLREVFPLIQDLSDIPMFSIIGLLATLDMKQAGYPLGGSLEFARGIERRYRDLGGEVHYKSAVSKILVENDKTVGVQLTDGSEHHSDIVISAADGRTTIFDMLEGKYINDEIRGYYDNLPLMHPLIYVALGVARSFTELTSTVSGEQYFLYEPVTIAGEEWNRLWAHIHNFDPSLAPKGKTLITVMHYTNYEYWKKLSEEPDRYKAEKEQIADQVVALLDRRFPGLAAQVEMRDVATPITWERYTGNWKGAYEGWQGSTKTFGMTMDKTLPGLADFYMVGQWVMPGGGLPTAVMSGRYVTQIICNNDKKEFVTSTP